MSMNEITARIVTKFQIIWNAMRSERCIVINLKRQDDTTHVTISTRGINHENLPKLLLAITMQHTADLHEKMMSKVTNPAVCPESQQPAAIN